MSLLDTMTFDFLVLSSTVQVLVDASSRHVTHSLFVKDQVCANNFPQTLSARGCTPFVSIRFLDASDLLSEY